MDNLIYNQRDIPKDKWRYGLRSSAATGCGWIATHNALRLLGHKTDIEELIRYYEWQLPLVHGNAGTSFWGPVLCFRHWGFPVEICAVPETFDEVVTRSDVCILFYHWRRGCRLGAHFIALHRLQCVPQLCGPGGPWHQSDDSYPEKQVVRLRSAGHQKQIKPQKRDCFRSLFLFTFSEQ